MMQILKIKIAILLLRWQKMEAESMAFEELAEMGKAKELVREVENKIKEAKFPEALYLKVLDYLEKDQKLQAVKDIVQIARISLKEAKDIADGMWDYFRNGHNTSLPTTHPEPTRELLATVKTMIANDKKLEAIKLIKDTLGIGLIEAKDMADKIAENTNIIGLMPKNNENTTSMADLSAQVINLLQQRQKIEAVKLAKEVLGVGLKEAKDFVDEIEQRMGL